MFVLGACIGAVVMGACCMNDSDLKNARGWDDDGEQ